MSKNIITSAITALVVALVIVSLVGGNQPDNNVGGSRFPNGISADSTSPSAGQVRGTTLTTTGAATLGGALTVAGITSSADVTVTTTNTATSTIEVGGLIMYATSTETALCVTPLASTTAPTEGSGIIMDVTYGDCPGT